MDGRIEEDVEGWPTRPVDGGFDGLRQLAAADFSGAVRAGGATMFVLNGRIVGIVDGTLSTFEDAPGTAHKAPHRSLPLLYAMQSQGGETQGKYYTEDTPISEVDQTLSEGNFTGYVELSENVLSGDYYLVYHAGRSMSVAFVGTSGKLLTGEEAFERADDEVGIYEVTAVDVDVRDVPGLVDEADDGEVADDAEAMDDGEVPDDARPMDDAEAAADAEAVDAADDSGAHDESDVHGESSAEADAGDARDGAATADGSAPNEATAADAVADEATATDVPAAGAEDVGTAPADAADADSTGAAAPPAESAGADGTDAGTATNDASEAGAPTNDATEAGTAGTEARSGDATAGAADAGAAAGGNASGTPEGGATSDPATQPAEPSGDARADQAADASVDTPADATTDAPSAGQTDQKAGTTLRDASSSAGERRSSEPRSPSGSGDGRAGDARDAQPRGEPGAATGDGADDVATPAASAGVGGPTIAEATTIPSLDPDRTGDLEQLARHPDAMPGGGGDGGGDGQRASRDRNVDDALEREVLEREDRIDRLEQRASNLRAERDDLAAERDRLAQRVEELEAENEALERELRELEADVGGTVGDGDDGAGDSTGATADQAEASGAAGSSGEAGGDATGQDAAANDDAADQSGEASPTPAGAGGAAAASGGSSDRPAADADLTPQQALDGTDLFVRYDSKSLPTLEGVRDGAERQAVDDNLRLDLHARFDADAATVAGQPFRSFLEETMAYRFVEWLVRDLPYEIRGTGQEAAMRDCYDALPSIDRVEFGGVVELTYDEEGETVEAEEAFDVVVRDRMGNPLFVADMNDSRDPANAGMLHDLQSGATRVKEAQDSLAGAFAVTRSFFDPDALETAAEATGGSLLSRDSRKSYVRVSRKRGYHLCLVEVREGNLHLNVPEL